MCLEEVTGALHLISPSRSIILRTARGEEAQEYAVTLSAAGWGEADLGIDLTGVQARWSLSEGTDQWAEWIPHLDLAVARSFTRGSAEHDRLWSIVQKPGKLTLKAQLDLKQMLQPAIQPGSSLDFEYPAEKVTLVLRSGTSLAPESGSLKRTGGSDREATLSTTTETSWVPLSLPVLTGPGTDLAVSWYTEEDSRPRAFSLRRVLMPWARRKDRAGSLQPGSPGLRVGDERPRPAHRRDQSGPYRLYCEAEERRRPKRSRRWFHV